MRYEGIPDAYEQLKSISRGTSMDKKGYKDFIENLQISSKSKTKLLNLTPAMYTGLATKLAKS